MAKKIQIAKQRPDAERRERQAQKFGRLLKMLQLIQSRGNWNPQNLAAELEVHERTIFRDLEVFQMAGVPWYFDERVRCYRVSPWYHFPVLNLTQDELLDQAAATVIAGSAGMHAGKGMKAATRKIAAKSSDEAEQLLDDVQRLMGVLDLKLAGNSRQQEHLRTIQWALINQKQIAGKYASPYKKKTVELTLHPYRLCLSRQAWYLIAKSTEAEADGPRTYRIARFESVRQIDRTAEIPVDFDLQQYFGNAWSIYRGQESYDVQLLFAPEAARIVTETNWHHTQKVRRHADGSATMTFTVDGLDEIVWWVLGWSGFVRVISPDKLRVMFVEQLQKALHENEEPAPEPAAKATKGSGRKAKNSKP